MENKAGIGENYDEVQLERKVTALMRDMGIPDHLNGFQYLKTSVVMCVEDMKLLGSVTKLLYPDVGKEFRTTGQKVERAIRNAIEASWQHGNERICCELFGYSSHDGKKRPTNSEYIAGIAAKILLEYREERRKK